MGVKYRDMKILLPSRLSKNTGTLLGLFLNFSTTDLAHSAPEIKNGVFS